MLRKNFWSGSLAYKDTLEEQYFIDSEPKGEVISSKIGGHLYFKIQMGVAGSIFELMTSTFGSDTMKYCFS